MQKNGTSSLLTIGGNPTSNLKGYLEITSLGEVNETLKSKEMVKMVHDDFMLIVNELKQGIVIDQDVNDEVSADLLISTGAALEKHAWMLRFYLD